MNAEVAKDRMSTMRYFRRDKRAESINPCKIPFGGKSKEFIGIRAHKYTYHTYNMFPYGCRKNSKTKLR